jgi:hypothetical protein
MPPDPDGSSALRIRTGDRPPLADKPLPLPLAWPTLLGSGLVRSACASIGRRWLSGRVGVSAGGEEGRELVGRHDPRSEFGGLVGLRTGGPPTTGSVRFDAGLGGSPPGRCTASLLSLRVRPGTEPVTTTVIGVPSARCEGSSRPSEGRRRERREPDRQGHQGDLVSPISSLCDTTPPTQGGTHPLVGVSHPALVERVAPTFGMTVNADAVPRRHGHGVRLAPRRVGAVGGPAPVQHCVAPRAHRPR